MFAVSRDSNDQNEAVPQVVQRTPAGVLIEAPSLPRGGYPEPLPVPGWKRAMDLALLLVILPLAGPIILLASLWVALVSSGVVFFVQERVGQGGRRFRCYKLRTMHHGCATWAHERHLQRILSEDKPMAKLDTADSRLIVGARILRALGIDELPQLLNVLRGEMSIVGPRPCIPYEADHYLPWQKQRFATLPGMTGLWQVRGKNRTTFSQMIQYDLEYGRRLSPWFDLRILLATPKAVLAQLYYVLKSRLSPAPTKASSDAEPMPIPSAGGSGVAG